MQNKKKIFIRVLVIIAILILVFVTCVISKTKLYTYNPIRAVIGYIAVKVFDVDHIDVQNIGGRVMYGKYDWNFNEYMQEKGFIEIPEEQGGAIHTFTNGKIKLHICMTGTRAKVYELEGKMKDDSGISIEERKQNYQTYKEEWTKKNQSSKVEVNIINENI